MVEAHEVEDGGMQVVDMDGVFDRLETEVIGGTVHRTPLHTATYLTNGVSLVFYKWFGWLVG